MRVKKSSKVSGTKLSSSELPQTVSSVVDSRYVNNWKILWTNNLFLSLLISFSTLLQSSSAEVYTNQFAVHVPAGEKRADEIAARHGFDNMGKIFEDHYHFVHSKIDKRSVEPHHEFHQLLSAEPDVSWHQQQLVKRRTKRDFLQIQPSLSSSSKSGRSRTVKRSRVASFNDPRWPAMWYLNRGPGLDMNVLEAWNEGITGKGIVVTILDDGLEKDHPDIVRNYDPLASFDVNSLDMDPMPTYDLTDSNRHGTRCAGEVAAEANNSICAVGVAFEAGVGGVRMLDGDVTDAVEARSLSHNPQHIDIYSASWGPDDDGKTVDGPGELATRAFSEGVTKGRGGKGSIFVWASGNGGRDHDNCNCDGYTNSIWTLSISSATENGLVPWYSEACSSTLATTYSSGGTGEKQIVTIDLHHSCTSSHTGTSASAPLAAGICALALQANTNLTWRDMQHIVVRTARPQNLIANDWATNGVGRNVSHSFGYGLMDAGAMVKMAKSWKTVPEQNRCEVKAPYTEKNIPAKSKVTLDLKVTNCSGVNFLEHVQAKVTLTSGRRGDLQIYLVSPSGTRSTLLAHRRHDLNRAGFTDWPFMTVHCWGENPIGKWTLEIHNEGRYAGKLDTWTLVAHGLSHNPNDPPPAEGIGVAMPGAMMGDLISSPTVAGGGAVPGSDSETGAKPAELHPPVVVPSSSSSLADPGTSLGHGSVVDLESSDNSIAIQPSHVHKGVDTVADIVVVPTASSSSSSACASVSSQGQCLDCSPQFVLFHGICITECPETFYRDSQRQGSIQRTSVTTTGAGASASTSTSSYICLPCHYSCKTCRGPNEYDCLSCHNDANLHVMPGDESVFSRNESHCYPAVLLQSVNTNEFWYKTLLVTVIVNVLLVCLLLIYICFQRRSPVEGPSERRSYRRVSPDDDQSTALDVGGYNAYGDYDEEEEDDSDAEDEAFTKLAPSNSQDEQRINFKNLASYVKSHNSVLPTSGYAADRRALLNNNSGLASSARTNSKNAV